VLAAPGDEVRQVSQVVVQRIGLHRQAEVQVERLDNGDLLREGSAEGRSSA
jgi:hypothetical protein